MALDSFIDDSSGSDNNNNEENTNSSSDTEGSGSTLAHYVEVQLKQFARGNGSDIEFEDGKIVADPHDLGVAYLTIAAKRYEDEVYNILDNVDS